MGVDHGRSDVFVAEKFLDRPYVIPIFQKVRRKAVPEGVTGSILAHAGLSQSGLNCALHILFIQVMSPYLS